MIISELFGFCKTLKKLSYSTSIVVGYQSQLHATGLGGSLINSIRKENKNIYLNGPSQVCLLHNTKIQQIINGKPGNTWCLAEY